MIKLIASDLDGTLLRNGAQSLAPETLDLIRRVIDSGIHFAAASGRQYANERLLFSGLEDRISYIAENGSLCIHRGKVISRGIIPDTLAYRIMRELKKRPGYEILVSREDTCLIEGKNPEFEDHVRNVLRYKTQIVDDVAKADGPFLKLAVADMTAFGSGRTVPDSSREFPSFHEFLKHLQTLFSSEIKVVTSGNIWIDFVVPDHNKGTALQDLLDLFSVSPEECMVFGDQYNDVEMLELAGESYAMSTGAPGISAHAAHVTGNVEEVLEELLKKQPFVPASQRS